MRGIEEHVWNWGVCGSDVRGDFEAVAEQWMITLASRSQCFSIWICLEHLKMRQCYRTPSCFVRLQSSFVLLTP